MRRVVAPAWLGGWVASLALSGPAPVVADEPDGLALFERKIRPVLVAECYSCHSAEAKRLKGGLRVDTRAALLAGGDSGPAVVPGQPEESPLVAALRHEDLAMPPKGRLADAVIADFERWVRMGAPDPREGTPAPPRRAGIDLDAGREFWSYRPPRRHEPPAVAAAAWPIGEVDRFLLAALEAKGLRPVADADRATLARRLAFDLTGLPPSPEELDAFLADDSPRAYEAMVDRLLASPRFGERWGRHWLDVARFGESLTLRGFVLKEAWRYRDYAIDAFNADLPFDRFVREQVAGDLLPAADLAERRRQLIATTFLAIGNHNLEEQDKPQLAMDVVDEQVDAIGKAFLGQTIGCARCHDHKFDPIPTADYYALAGILRNCKSLEHANVSKWIDRPLPMPPEQEARVAAHEAAVAALERRIEGARADLAAQGKAAGPARTGAVPAAALAGIVVDDGQAKKVGMWQESRHLPTFIGSGYLHDLDAGKGDKTLTFVPDLPEAGVYEVRLAYSPGPGRARAVPVTVFGADGEAVVPVDMRAAPPIDGRFVSLGRHRFERSGQAFVLIATEGTSGHVTADAVVFLPAEAADKPATAAGGAGAAPPGADDPTLRDLQTELKTLLAAAPVRERFLSVVEAEAIGDARVHHRGSVHNLGEVAPRGFLRAASFGAPPTMPEAESGRRELADWLADPRNPLTARVIVNRTWHWLFGAGLVRTVDNFGTTGERPSHPELLDDLAVRFVEEGWSLKALVRRLVLSHAYRLADADDDAARAADPENRLRWRMDRRRLDAECLRDAILAVAGTLRDDRGGPSFPADLAADYGFRDASPRRSVYLPAFRNALPEIFEAFDFADPSLVVGRRDVSTVAPQALFLLNHPFVAEQARLAAARLRDRPGLDADGRIDLAYRLALARPPTAGEAAIVREFLADGESVEAWALVFRALFGSADFRSVD